MVEVMNKERSHWWWFDSHNKSCKRSPWLQSTLAELDRKTKALLKLIEEDADSFAQRAEMYYMKRPALISLVEEFYRAHRSLAEQYDLVKSDHGTRLLTTFGSPSMSIIHQKPTEFISLVDRTYYSYSESSNAEEYAESEVDDPEQEGGIQIESENEEAEDPEHANETQVSEEIRGNEVPEQEDEIEVAQESKKDNVASEVYNDEIIKLREEIKTIKEENKRQKDQLRQKDEEKMEVIRQLSMAVGVLKDENFELKKQIARVPPKKHSS